MNSDTKTKAQPQDSEETEAETDKARFEKDYILETGSVLRTKGRHAIHCLTVIGQIEGHSIAPQTQKTTKYEHVIPQLVSIEEDPEVEGLLVILNTVGGDVRRAWRWRSSSAASRSPAPRWCWAAGIPSAFRLLYQHGAASSCPRPP